MCALLAPATTCTGDLEREALTGAIYTLYSDSLERTQRDSKHSAGKDVRGEVGGGSSDYRFGAVNFEGLIVAR